MIGSCFKNRSIHFVCCCCVLILVMAVDGREAAGQNPVKKTINIVDSSYDIHIAVPGNVDESRFLWPNLPGETPFFSSVRIRNEGTDTIVNPRLTLNGFKMPLTTQELISTLTNDSPDALDRILRVFYAMTRYGNHESLPSGDPVYPLGFFLNYSYGVCFDQVMIQMMLWEVMGFPHRTALPLNHASAEVQYPRHGRTILLDTDYNAYYLKHDNWTIASAQDVREDPMLILRSTHSREYYRSPWQEGDPIVDMWGSSEKMAALYPFTKSPPVDDTASGPHLSENIAIHLRPGESYGWHSDKNQYHKSLKDNTAILNVTRQLVWETDLDLKKPYHRWFINDRPPQKTTQGPQYVQIDPGHPWVIPYGFLFPVMGANLTLKLDPGSEKTVHADSVVIRITLKTPDESVGEDVPLAKLADRSYSLDPILHQLTKVVRKIDVLISIKSSKNLPGKGVRIKGLWIQWFCQSTAFAFRSLKAGKNLITYTDASQNRHAHVEIETHPATVPLPRFSKGIFSPGDGKEIAEHALQFVWPAVPGNGAKGYQWQVSAHRDMRYPLSPTFERLIDGSLSKRTKGNIVFQLPWRGMLPIGRELFWRVRSYDRSNLAGHWSPVQSFKIRGPGVPQNCRLVEKDGKSILVWEPDPKGTLPVTYEIHTSSLVGFMPTNKRHRILGMSSSEVMKYQWTDVYASDWPFVPPTHLTTTKQKEWIVYDENGPTHTVPQKLGAHYRIIAIDAEGSRSCPSPQIHLPHPRIISPMKVVLPPGTIRWKVPVISSLGRVLAAAPNYRLGLWETSTLVYSLLDVPKSMNDWTIDGKTGIVHGKLAGGKEVTVTVLVHDTRHGNKNVKKITFAGK